MGAVLAAVLLGTSAAADPARERLLALEAVPLDAAGRADYARFLLQAIPRAFAVGRGGAWGWAAGFESLEQAAARALALCGQWDAACRLYAADLALVPDGVEAPSGTWFGGIAAVASAAPPPMAGGDGWTLRGDARFLQHGPEVARGAYVWAHGRAAGGADSRGDQPQPHVRAFNNAGWDVLRLDRAPATDTTAAGAVAMEDALWALRAAGYARVVAAGQSRGGWNALQALARPGLVDGVIAIAAAAHGPRDSPAQAGALADLAAIVAAAASPAARVAVVAFTDDEFQPDPDARAAILDGLAPRVGALWLLDRPEGIVGHGGGGELAFTVRYGPCLLAFVDGGPPCPEPAARHASNTTPAADTTNPPP